jgi:hypothetical protein
MKFKFEFDVSGKDMVTYQQPLTRLLEAFNDSTTRDMYDAWVARVAEYIEDIPKDDADDK